MMLLVSYVYTVLDIQNMYVAASLRGMKAVVAALVSTLPPSFETALIKTIDLESSLQHVRVHARLSPFSSEDGSMPPSSRPPNPPQHCSTSQPPDLPRCLRYPLHPPPLRPQVCRTGTLHRPVPRSNPLHRLQRPPSKNLLRLAPRT